MLDLFEAIRERRSVRKYQARTVPNNLVEEILAAAGWAPSAHNAQPWRYIVLTEAGVKRELAEAMAGAWATDMSRDDLKIEAEMLSIRVERFANAPVLILACLTMQGMNEFSDDKRMSVERDLAMQSLGASLQNLLLAAHAKGLGACWFCAPGFCKNIVRRVMEIPEEVEPEGLIVMGYAAENPPVPQRKMLYDYCFKNKWAIELG